MLACRSTRSSSSTVTRANHSQLEFGRTLYTQSPPVNSVFIPQRTFSPLSSSSTSVSFLLSHQPQSLSQQQKRGLASQSSNVIQINSSNYEEKVIKSTKPVILDCFATWCGPCRVLGPILEKTVEKTSGAVQMAVVDIDESCRWLTRCKHLVCGKWNNKGEHKYKGDSGADS